MRSTKRNSNGSPNRTRCSTAYANEAARANAARAETQQELAPKEQELLELKRHLVEADGQLAEMDRLSEPDVADLEPAQGRVHWLEVQLSEKEAQHRHAFHDLENELAVRDRRLAELAQQAQLLQERERRIAALEQRVISCRRCNRRSTVRPR